MSEERRTNLKRIAEELRTLARHLDAEQEYYAKMELAYDYFKRQVERLREEEDKRNSRVKACNVLLCAIAVAAVPTIVMLVVVFAC